MIIDALLRSYAEGMDVVNLSLGGPDGWTVSSSAVVASRLQKRGLVVAISAGNEGADGPWYTESPSGGKGVLAIGSVDK